MKKRFGTGRVRLGVCTLDSLQRFVTQTPPLLILILSLMLTAIALYFNRSLVIKEYEVKQEQIVKDILYEIDIRVLMYTNALRATGALFESSETVTRGEFRRFIEHFNLQNRFPGIQGIGYAVRLSKQNVEKHISEVRREGYRDYTVWPRDERKDFYSIMYIEPEDWRNKRAMGFDMSSEESRRVAMERARDSGALVASSKVILVQETALVPQFGFLIYAPIYNSKMPISTIDERRRALTGFVYSPFRAGDLFQQIMKKFTPQLARLKFEVFDGVNLDQKNLLYSSTTGDTTKSERTDSELDNTRRTFKTIWDQINIFGNQWYEEKVIPFSIMDRPWVFKIGLKQKIEGGSGQLTPLVIGAMGVVISFLIFLVLRNTKKANLAKSRFLAAMSHEIRTPLGIIIGFADLALENPNLENEVRNYLLSIKNNGGQLAKLIGEVLDLAKIEANRLDIEKIKISLPGFLDEIMDSFQMRAREKGVRLVLNKDHQIPHFIETDPLKLRQILINLINNAIKFTEQGEISITPSMSAKPEGTSPIEVNFIIKDTGIGMSREDQVKLFQPFFQAKTTKTKVRVGTGLGLALSKQLAKGLGGDVELIESQPSKGTIFRFYLPIEKFEGLWDEQHPSESTQIDKSAVREKNLLEGVIVLLAEDSIDNQLLFSRYLKMAGATVIIASNGQEAIEKAASEKHDITLMDIQMPILDGFEATQLLRKKGYQKPIFALTAHAFKEERERILKAGFNRYLTKPISRAALIDEIHAEIFKLKNK